MTRPTRLKRLAVWMDGRRIATLTPQSGWRMRLSYNRELADSKPGAILLSMSMPIQLEAYQNDVAGSWIDNLLPEGPPRGFIARALRVRPFDTFGILAEVGRDCAGAVMFLPEDQNPDQSLGGCRILGDQQLRELVDNLATHPLGVDAQGKTRLSLAGAQEKALLTKAGDDWAQPINGAPSTFIVKPEPSAYPGMARAEYFCLTWARAAGLDASEAELFDLDGRSILAVQRYDRDYLADGSIRRIHQEDACQALGRSSQQKYESQGGPTFREVAELLRRHASDPIAELVKLAKVVVITAATGNADGHGKNISFFLERGVARLAPLYDVIPTIAWGSLDTDAGMYVNGRPNINRWVQNDLVQEATSWGIPLKQAKTVVHETLTSLADTLADTAESVNLAPDIRRHISDRIDRLVES